MSANHLSKETSPYLLQHAHNPVDWYPWGDEALNLAREQNKPILLSIGYSACHWCHVMAHESFEDDEVAALMNRYFVNIKVDREERPDLDQIYQLAHNMLTGRHGGWPLTMFLTPQQQPYYGGTYFPPQSRYNLPGFAELLPQVAAFYHEHGDKVEQQNAQLAQAFARTLPETGQEELSDAPLLAAMRELESGFDELHGGFGDAPKFPHPAELELCLRETARSGEARPAQMALYTLERMARGGIFDQLGGGFFRYSVDEVWEIPHFEKMLYDNAQLLPLYADAWQLTHNSLFRCAAEQTAAWLMREMQSPQGGYYATLDADSEHEEGKYYIWSAEELRGVLSAEEYSLCDLLYGLQRQPNFEGRWHLHEVRPLGEVARQLDCSEAACAELLGRAHAKLFAVRERRVRPGRDDKILASWNGLMINGLAHAARIFDRTDWLQSARSAADFVRAHLWCDGRLRAVHKDGQARFSAYLDDYGFLLEALLELLQAEFQPADLDWARELAEVLLTQFRDDQRGDFYFTAHDHETLIHRPKPVHDNATPGGNAVAARALQRLGHILGDTRYTDAAQQVLQLYAEAMARHPAGFATLLIALQEYVTPLRLLQLYGEQEQLSAWHAALRGIYAADVVVLTLTKRFTDLPATLDKPFDAAPAAWLCQGGQCLPPIRNVQELSKALQTVRSL